MALVGAKAWGIWDQFLVARVSPVARGQAEEVSREMEDVAAYCSIGQSWKPTSADQQLGRMCCFNKDIRPGPGWANPIRKGFKMSCT